MAIAYVTRTSTHAASNDTISANVGTPTVGNFLLLSFTYQSDLSISTHPSGWTQIDTALTGSTASSSQEGALYYKIAAASEPNPSIVVSASTGNLSTVVFEFSGVDAQDPIDGAFQKSASTFATSRTTPTVNTATDNAMWLCGFWHDDNTDVPASNDATGETTIAIEQHGSTAAGYGLIYQIIASAPGNGGTPVWTLGGNEAVCAWALCLGPFAITSVSSDDIVGSTENPWSIVGTGFGSD